MPRTDIVQSVLDKLLHSVSRTVSISRAFLARTLSRDMVLYGDFAAAELVRFNCKMAAHPTLWFTTYLPYKLEHHAHRASPCTKAGDSISHAIR